MPTIDFVNPKPAIWGWLINVFCPTNSAQYIRPKRRYSGRSRALQFSRFVRASVLCATDGLALKMANRNDFEPETL